MTKYIATIKIFKNTHKRIYSVTEINGRIGSVIFKSEDRYKFKIFLDTIGFKVKEKFRSLYNKIHINYSDFYNFDYDKWYFENN